MKEIEKRQSAMDQLSALRKLKDTTKQDVERIIQEEGKSEQKREQETEKAMEAEPQVMNDKEEPDERLDREHIDNGKGNKTKSVLIEEETEDIDDVFEKIDQMEIDFDEALEEEYMEGENSNDIILELYKNGESIIEIAKQLGLGVGEVKLVIDLYQGE